MARAPLAVTMARAAHRATMARVAHKATTARAPQTATRVRAPRTATRARVPRTATPRTATPRTATRAGLPHTAIRAGITLRARKVSPALRAAASGAGRAPRTHLVRARTQLRTPPGGHLAPVVRPCGGRATARRGNGGGGAVGRVAGLLFPAHRKPSRSRGMLPGVPVQRLKSTAVVFAPLITTAIVSPGAGW